MRFLDSDSGDFEDYCLSSCDTVCFVDTVLHHATQRSLLGSTVVCDVTQRYLLGRCCIF